MKNAENIYEQELTDALKALERNAPSSDEVSYFKKVVCDYFTATNISKKTPEVIVIGTSVPEEIIYASGVVPYFIIGSSPNGASATYDMLPRDTDPISRSVLGHLKWRTFDNALIIISVTNDNFRKLAYLLKYEGKNVFTLDFPPIKDSFGYEKWFRQIENLKVALSKHTGNIITQNALRKAVKSVDCAREQMRCFAKLTSGNVSGLYKMFILNSYYYSNNIFEWCIHLKALNDEMEQKWIEQKKTGNGKILLVGSPIYFPNFKIPFLLRDVGLDICGNIDYTMQKNYNKSTCGNINLSKLTRNFLENDCSSAYIGNDTMMKTTKKFIENSAIDGVVYHILKGHIGYDFGLEQMELLFAEYDIPVFRLETDYNYQDIEQLRIRMEAFAELIAHRQIRKGGRNL